MYISWKSPSVTQDLPITGYVVEYIYLITNTSIKLSTTTLNLHVAQLIPKTKYMFRVMAVNDLGVGPFVVMNYTIEERSK